MNPARDEEHAIVLKGSRRHVIVVLNLPVPDDRRVWAQAEAARDDGREVVVVCPALRSYSPGRRVIDGITVRYFRAFEGAGLISTALEATWNTMIASVLALLALLGPPRKMATVQVCNPPDTLFPLLWASRALGARTIYDQHDVAPAMARTRQSFTFLARLFEVLERLTVRAAEMVITSSAEQQERLALRYGVDAALTRTAPVSADPKIRSHRSGEMDIFRFGYVGVIGEQDGVEVLVRAADTLRREGASFEVHIAGDGPFFYRLDDLVRQRALGEFVKLHGWLAGSELETFLTTIDAMVVPDPESEYSHYCAMNKVTHAMALGIPVVATPLNENRRVLGDAGLFAHGFDEVALATAMRSLLTMPGEERQRLVLATRSRYEHALDWQSHRAVYLRAIGRP